MPHGSFVTSISEILRYMGISINGKHVNMVAEELDRLYKTNISWVLSFDIDKI